MRIHIFGSIFNNTGYDSHCRQLVNALYKENPDISLDTPKNDDWVRYANDNELKIIKTPYDDSATTIMIGQPQFWRYSMADKPKRFGGFVVWEGEYIPTYWLEYLADKRVDFILTPSNHVKNAILNTINKVENTAFKSFYKGISDIANKIHIVPHGVDTELFLPEPTLKETPFTFIMNKGWSQGLNDRGGIQYALKAFHKEFDTSEPVQMIAKINPVYNLPGWNLDNQMQAIGIDGITNIKINLDSVPFNYIPKLYNRGHVFVSSTRCDAFNLPGLEAMSCSLPTIQTNYGGQIDYMTKENSLYVDYKLEEVDHDIVYEGNKWASPDILDLRKKLRYAFDHKNEMEKMGTKALLDSKQWTWNNSVKKLLKVLE